MQILGESAALIPEEINQQPIETMKHIKPRHRVKALATLAAFSVTTGLLIAADVSGDRLNIGSGHSLSGSVSSIAGGLGNTITDYSSFIGGGDLCTVDAHNAVIGGGYENYIHSGGLFSFIGGGNGNVIWSDYSVIAGGDRGVIEAAAIASVVGGGSQNRVGEVYGTIGGGVNNSLWSTGATIAGGGVNTILTNADYSLIGGGAHNLIANEAEYSSISAGLSNAIGTHAEYSYVGNGEQNTNDASYGYLGGGYRNFVGTNATHGTLGGGLSNKVTAARATVPGGEGASAANFGQMAYASGVFAGIGDAQSSLYVLRNSTANATSTELFLNGSSLRAAVPSGSTWTFEVVIVGRSSGGSSAGYRTKGVIDNNSGTTSFVVAPTIETLAEDVAGWDATVEADNTNDALVIKVTGAASTNIRWVATVRTVEVKY